MVGFTNLHTGWWTHKSCTRCQSSHEHVLRCCVMRFGKYLDPLLYIQRYSFLPGEGNVHNFHHDLLSKIKRLTGWSECFQSFCRWRGIHYPYVDTISSNYKVLYILYMPACILHKKLLLAYNIECWLEGRSSCMDPSCWFCDIWSVTCMSQAVLITTIIIHGDHDLTWLTISRFW